MEKPLNINIKKSRICIPNFSLRKIMQKFTWMLLLLTSSYTYSLFGQQAQFPVKISIQNLDTLNKEELFLYKALKRTKNDSAIPYFEKALKESTSDSKYYPYILLHSAYAFMQNQKYNDALLNIDLCLKFALTKHIEYYIYQSYLLKAQIAFLQKDLDNSVVLHDKAIKSTTDEYLQNFAKLSLSNFFFSQENAKMGTQLLDEIYDYYIKHNKNINPRLATQMLVAKSKRIEENISYDYILDAKKIVGDSNFTFTHIKIEKEYARLLLLDHEDEKALEIYKNLILNCRKKKYKQETHLIYHTLAIYYNKNGHYQQSQHYINRILSVKHQSNFENHLFQLSIDNYTQLGALKKALEYSVKYNNFKDSIRDINTEQKYTEWSVKYETEKKTQENNLLKKEQKVKNLELKQEKLISKVLIFSVLISLLLLYIFYRLYRLKEQHRKELESQNALISIQNEDLQKANKTKETFFTLIAHDLINPYHTILGYTNLLKDHYFHFDENKRIKTINTIQKSVENNYQFVKNLLNWAKANQKNINIQKEQVQIVSLVRESVAPLQLLLDKKEIQFKILNKTNNLVTTDQQILKTLLVNLLSNAIKFTPKNGEITVDIQKEDNKFVITITDTGIGIKEDQLQHIFSLSQIHSTFGTEKEKGNGLGLLVCYEMMTLIQGEIQITSEVNQGTTIKLNLHQ